MIPLIHLFEQIQQLAWKFSPHHRRIQAKRHLETILTANGINKKFAAYLANQTYRKK